MNKTSEVCNIEMQSSCTHWIKFHICWHKMVLIKKKATNIWEDEVGINANFARFVRFWNLYCNSESQHKINNFIAFDHI